MFNAVRGTMTSTAKGGPMGSGGQGFSVDGDTALATVRNGMMNVTVGDVGESCSCSDCCCCSYSCMYAYFQPSVAVS